jgi:hypothetical protein
LTGPPNEEEEVSDTCNSHGKRHKCIQNFDVKPKSKRFLENRRYINPLNAELNLICHLLALLGAHNILHVGRIRVKKEIGVKFTDGIVWISLIWFRIGTVKCCCGHGYELAVVIISGKFLVLLRDCYLRKYLPALRS